MVASSPCSLEKEIQLNKIKNKQRERKEILIFVQTGVQVSPARGLTRTVTRRVEQDDRSIRSTHEDHGHGVAGGTGGHTTQVRLQTRRVEGISVKTFKTDTFRCSVCECVAHKWRERRLRTVRSAAISRNRILT